MTSDSQASVDPALSNDPRVLREEIDRLRSLVGPNEMSYLDLKAELAAAEIANREALMRAGTYRGRSIQLATQLERHSIVEQRLVHSARLLKRPLRNAKRRFDLVVAPMLNTFRRPN